MDWPAMGGDEVEDIYKQNSGSKEKWKATQQPTANKFVRAREQNRGKCPP
jgi:hypothetical protein